MNEAGTAAPRRARRPAGWRWTTGSAFVALACLTALFYLPVLLGLRTFPDGDFTHHFLPFNLYQQHQLISGRLPLWNPYTYGGHPFLADVQAAVFYPISNALLLLTLPFADPGLRLYVLELEAVLQVFLAACFTFLLVRDLADGPWPGFLAGITFALSGYLAGYPPVQLAVLRTAIWLPLILWLLLRAFRAALVQHGRTAAAWGWWIAAGAAVAAAFLAGHSQTFLFVAYTSAAWIVFLAAIAWRRARAAGRAAPVSLAFGSGLVGAGAVALGLSAAQLLPSWEFVQLSVRANVDYAFVSGGFPLQDTWQALLPAVLTEYSPLYIGVIGLGLAFLSLGELGRSGSPAPSREQAGRQPALVSRRGGILFFGVLTLLALLLSYGANGFLYPLFYRYAPGWNLFRGQERAAYLVALGLSVLAGYGTAAITRLPLRRRAWLATLYAGLAILGVYLFGMLWQLPGRTAIGPWRYLALALVTIFLVTALALLLRMPGWSRRRSWILTILAVANLFLANAATNVDQFTPGRKTILPPEVEALQQASAAAAGSGLPARSYNEFRAYEDYGMRAGIEDVWGASPLRLARYDRLFDQFPLDRMWRLLGVGQVLTWRKELFGPTKLLAEFPQAKDTTYLHQLGTANPRAWLVTSVEPANDAQAVKRLADHQFDLERVALLAPEVISQTVAGGGGAGAAGSVQLSQPAPGRLQVGVDTASESLLLISENWMPGWRVENVRCPSAAPGCSSGRWAAGGLPLLAPVRADLTLIGVPVPAGKTEFELTYQPDSVRVGLIVSAVSAMIVAAVLGLLAWFYWRRRRSPQPARDL